MLADADSDAAWWIPLEGRLDADWTATSFDALASGFTAGKAAMGYETTPSARYSFAGELKTTLPARTHAVYSRTEFQRDDVSSLTGLTLRMKYDDGFVAYLNGVEVARAGAPDKVNWFSSAPDGSRPDAQALAFTDFDLSSELSRLRSGSNVLAIHGLNSMSDGDMLLVPELVAATAGPASAVGYMPVPTPGAANVSDVQVFDGFVSDVQMDVPRGLYDAAIDVAITTGTPGAVIRYTTDGSLPTLEHGLAYTAPIQVGTTTTLRAAAFKADHIPSPVVTQTYVFPQDVIRQPTDPAGFPEMWSSRGEGPIRADYEMDPDVVNDPAYSDEIVEGLRSIPTMSLVMDPEDLFGSNGIYTNSGQRGDRWERATSLEILQPDGSSFQADSGIEIHGYSWRFHGNTPKHSFRLEFGPEYGPSKLEYKLFPDAPVDRFDSIVLRAQGGRAWAGLQNPDQAQYLRDAFARDTARDMGKVDGHAAFFHLYLNGLYWGLYHAVERPDCADGRGVFRRQRRGLRRAEPADLDQRSHQRRPRPVQPDAPPGRPGPHLARGLRRDPALGRPGQPDRLLSDPPVHDQPRRAGGLRVEQPAGDRQPGR